MISSRAAAALLLSAAAVFATPASGSLAGSTAQQLASRAARAVPDPDEYEELVGEFVAALESYRAGNERARDSLERVAGALASKYDRDDAVRVVRYYARLDRESRVLGLELEREFDRVRSAVAASEEAGVRRADPAHLDALRALLERAESANDVTPAARIGALLARLETRRIERRQLPDAAERAAIQRAERVAQEALTRFRTAEQRTPRLEPTWILARLALLAGRPFEAERRFAELDELALAVGRPQWRERALLGLVGVARDRGGAFAARRALEELATFRSPSTCWSLSRELAIQRLSEDEPERALELLEAFPPHPSDPEIDVDEASEEWRALTVAAKIRAGDLDAAAESLRRAPEPENVAALEARVLAEVTLLLDRGEAERALERLDAFGARAGASELGRVEALVLRGRGLAALGRLREALVPLEEAFDAARARDRARAPTLGTSVRDGSAVGEWLGLSAVERLASAHAELGAPIRAAATIEAAHAGCTIDEAQARLVALAASETLGAVTWIVGADQTLAVHVRSDGSADAVVRPIGRKEAVRAVERLRAALLETRISAETPRARDLRREVAEALLPSSLRASLDATPRPAMAPSLALLPHGVLERLPFEALLQSDGSAALGIATAITVLDRLRDPRSLAPPIEGRRARWIGLGAPTGTGLAALPDARRELRSLEILHPRMEVVAGDAFTAARLLEALSGDLSVHVATHVVRTDSVASIAPLALAASGGAAVTAEQIARRAPRVPLVVLAACGSAEGVTVDGLGARSIAHAALEGGTRAAVVTLWPIEDGAGRTASIAFHAALMDGATPSEALRRARNALERSGAAPSEWAAYRLLGTP